MKKYLWIIMSFILLFPEACFNANKIGMNQT